MPKLSAKVGTTSKILHVLIKDTSSSTGAGLTGLLFNTASLTCYYLIEGAATPVAVSLVTATVGTYTSGGFKEIDSTHMQGLYEFHAPNLALASGKSVKFFFQGAANMQQTIMELELTAVDNQSATGFVTSVPAVVGAVGSVTGAVASVTAGVTVTTNNDKTGYALTGGEHTNIATDTQTGLTAQGYTSTRAGFMDVLNGIVAAIWAAGSRTLTAIANVTVGGYASGQDPATLVLGATASTWNTASTIGNKINSAASAGDPWTTALPGSYSAGQAGYIVGRNVDAQVSTRSTFAGGAVASVTGNVGGSVASVTAPVTIDLTTNVPLSDLTSLSAITIGHALAAAFVEMQGAETESGTSYLKKNPDGSTARTFTLTLDGNGNPTARA